MKMKDSLLLTVRMEGVKRYLGITERTSSKLQSASWCLQAKSRNAIGKKKPDRLRNGLYTVCLDTLSKDGA